MRILDTHLHLVYPDRFSYPWLNNAPAINRPWSAEAYFAEAVPLGVESALHMEVDVAEGDIDAESRFMASVHPRVVGVISSCRPEHDDFAAQLVRIAANPGVRGLRRILHESDDALSQTPLFRDNIRSLTGRGLTFDLCVRADQLPLARALADTAPDVQYVLDHCGVPDMTPATFPAWQREIAALAERPNVAGKVSGIIAYGGPDWSTETLRPYVEHMIASFGWDRVVWGSDHPVCTREATLAQWVGATRALLAGASDDEQAALLHRNAERIYALARD